jgi:hypothetical protein
LFLFASLFFSCLLSLAVAPFRSGTAALFAFRGLEACSPLSSSLRTQCIPHYRFSLSLQTTLFGRFSSQSMHPCLAMAALNLLLRPRSPACCGG